MIDLNATAVRYHSEIVVNVRGQLVTTCDHADVYDKYPGGSRHYLVDPGAAQVFIAEREICTGPCGQIVMPWAARVHIPDTTHRKVEVFVNEQLELTIPVTESSPMCIVYSWVGGIVPQVFQSIVPANHVVPSDYTKEFGPASYEECVKWTTDHPAGPVV